MRRALLIGLDDYPDAPLSGCVNDAKEMARLLARNADGSPNFDCISVLCPPERVTKRTLAKEIETLFKDEADVALLFFSGHGTENNLGGYLVTPDAQEYSEGMSMTDVLTLANDSRAREVVIILDCCFSGAFGQVPAVDNRNVSIREGVSILTASRSTQVSVENPVTGRGLFTSLVTNALDGGAADVMGKVTIAGVYAYVDQALGAWQQRPLLKAHVSRLSALRMCPPAVEPSTLRQLPGWFPNPTYEYPLDPSYEPDAEPDHPEHEAIFAQMQKCRDAKLIVPVGEQHLYFAAMHSKACRLTPLGTYYWHLANEGRI